VKNPDMKNPDVLHLSKTGDKIDPDSATHSGESSSTFSQQEGRS
jgi:hypothetical protein